MQPIPPRHLARHRSRLDLTRNRDFVAHSLVLLAVVLTVTIVLANLPDSSGPGAAPGEQASDATSVSLPSGAKAFGNLVTNWSFEQDLSGWQVLGAADAGREPQGRTSGSCASVRSRGPQPGRIGLALPGVVQAADKGSRFVAKAWVRSTAPGLEVTVRLVGSGAKPESSQTTTTTLPGLAWRAVIVDHTTAARTDLAIVITADGVLPGDSLLVDEVTVRQG